MSLAAGLKTDLTRRRSRFADAARRVHRGVDEEAIHDLRVSTRRLIAFLRLWPKLWRPSAERSLRRELRSIRRRAGDARELEVHVELIRKHLSSQSPETRAAATELLERMTLRLARRRRRAAEWVRPKRLKRLLRRLDRMARDLAPRPADGSETIDVANARADALKRQAKDAMKTALLGLDDQAMHQARIAVKKWRYAIECLQAVAARKEETHLARLREIQEVLGVVHDQATLRDRLSERIGRNPGDPGVEALRPLVAAAERERREAVKRVQQLAGTIAPGPRRRGAVDRGDSVQESELAGRHGDR